MNTVEVSQQGDALAEIFADNPALYYAYEIFNRPDGDYCKETLEARLLARQDNEKIARSLRIALPDTIEWYERLFFNVRDSLDSVDYISKQVIGPLVGVGTADLGLSAKFFGYFCGEAMLEFMLQGIDRSLPPPKVGDNIAEYADEFFNTMLRGRSIVAATTFQIDTYKIMPLLELHTKLIEEHNKAKASAGPKNQLEETVSAILTGIPWSIGDSREKLLNESPLGTYIGHAAEPRADDLMRIASGEEVPHLMDIKERRLPPPRKKKDASNEIITKGSRESDS